MAYFHWNIYSKFPSLHRLYQYIFVIDLPGVWCPELCLCHYLKTKIWNSTIIKPERLEVPYTMIHEDGCEEVKVTESIYLYSVNY